MAIPEHWLQRAFESVGVVPSVAAVLFQQVTHWHAPATLDAWLEDDPDPAAWAQHFLAQQAWFAPTPQEEAPHE